MYAEVGNTRWGTEYWLKLKMRVVPELLEELEELLVVLLLVVLVLLLLKTMAALLDTDDAKGEEIGVVAAAAVWPTKTAHSDWVMIALEERRRMMMKNTVASGRVAK